jgi:DNA-binding transcriptional LysR family regulator
VLAYRHGNLTVVGREMGLTQSAISVLLRELEERTGVRLFDRTTRRVTPTAAAQDVLPLAESALREVGRFGATLRGLSELDRGRIRFAATAAVSAMLLPPILGAFARAHGTIEVTLLDLAPDLLVGALHAGDAEFALGTVESDDPLIATETLAHGDLCVIHQRGGELDRVAALSWCALGDLPMIAVAQGSGLRDLVARTMWAHGGQFKPRFEVSLLGTALALTSEGLGISILPAYLAHRLPANLRAIPIVEPVLTRELRLLTRTDITLSPASRALLLSVRKHLATQCERKIPVG